MPIRHDPDSAEDNIFLYPAKSSLKYFPKTKAQFLKINQLDKKNIQFVHSLNGRCQCILQL
ncbi:hypothetical protein CAP36_04605 [Chitinophagaceae bacterium IBVUCB2]|nr:hypothetical protein CAP36_04605 [Chitinophagaceae bacterium IBVUCB2]